MCRCVTVATDHRRCWESEALLRANDVYDTLAFVVKAEIGEVEGFYIGLEGGALRP